MRRVLLFGLTASAIGLLVGAGLMEGALRAYAAANTTFGAAFREYDPMAVQIEPIGTLGYRQRAHATFHYANGTTATSNSLGYRGPEVATEPAPGTIRIILLGGSTTHGFGVNDDQTIDAYMREIYAQKHPGKHAEVVNLALDGYDTYQMLQRLEIDGLPRHPTVVVLNEGINDVRNAQFPRLQDADPRTLLWESDLQRLREEAKVGPSLWTRMKHYLYIARAPGYLRNQLAERRVNKTRQMQSDRVAAAMVQEGRDTLPHDPPYPDAAVFFARHMAAMTDSSVKQGAAVLLSTPPSALRTYAPTVTSSRTYWIMNARVTQAYRDTLAERLRTLASTERAQGHAVGYVSPVVPNDLYLDDCHLKPEGNRIVAAAFIDQIDALLGSRQVASR
jgi:lysophospholipase L1-like esterase